MAGQTPRRPLDGYLVVDRAGTVATAVCARLFADFGARVVNSEGPELERLGVIGTIPSLSDA